MQSVMAAKDRAAASAVNNDFSSFRVGDKLKETARLITGTHRT